MEGRHILLELNNFEGKVRWKFFHLPFTFFHIKNKESCILYKSDLKKNLIQTYVNSVSYLQLRHFHCFPILKRDSCL